MKYFLLAIGAVWLTGCSLTREPPSAILRKAEACGAGDPTRASVPALQDWFGKHRECAVAVDEMCKPIRQQATANWTDSAEGRVCLAARNIAQWIRKPSSDRQTFESGWK
jgi:hypothetical protein